MLSFIVLLLLFLATAGLIWFFIQHDRGAKEPPMAIIEAIGFGVLAVIIAVALEWWLVKDVKSTGNLTLGVLAAFMKVGIIEEAAKFIPLALFIHRRPYFNEYTDGVVYFCLAGLTFGFLENLEYLAIHGTQTGLFRLVVLLYFHGATAGIVGYYFAKHKLKPESIVKTLLVLAAMMVLHGFYDFSLSGVSDYLPIFGLVFVAFLNCGLFLYYREAQIHDQQLGLASAGNNKFCRHCGRPNPKRTLYCEYCGTQA